MIDRHEILEDLRTTLTPDQITIAEERISNLHPLKNIPLRIMFPKMSRLCCFCCRSADGITAVLHGLDNDENESKAFKRFKDVTKIQSGHLDAYIDKYT